MSTPGAAAITPAAGATNLRGWIAWAIGAAALVAGGIVLAHGDPAYHPAVCMLRRIAGVPCPTCGMTRAFLLLGRADLLGSLALHPGAVVLVLQAVVGWGAWGLWLGQRVSRRPDRWLPHLVALDALLLLALWLVRLASGTLPR